MAQMYTTAAVYPYEGSFDVGLNLLLDGIERIAGAFPERWTGDIAAIT